jgi:hypothetical protein
VRADKPRATRTSLASTSLVEARVEAAAHLRNFDKRIRGAA